MLGHGVVAPRITIDVLIWIPIHGPICFTSMEGSVHYCVATNY